MTLTGQDAIDGLFHATASRGQFVVAFHDGKRYGGFTSVDGVRFTAEKLAWARGSVIVNIYAEDVAETECREPVMESRQGVEVVIL